MHDPVSFADPTSHLHPSAVPVSLEHAPRESVSEPSSLSENAYLAAAIELQAQLDGAATLPEAAHQVVHRLAELLGSDRVLIAWRDRESAPMKCLADTKSSSTQDGDPLRRFELAAAEEVLALGGVTVWPESEHENTTQGGAMAIAQFARQTRLKQVIGVCLQNNNHEATRGCLLVSEPSTVSASSFLKALAGPLASKLHAIERAEPGLMELGLRRFLSNCRESRLRWIGILGVSIILLMFAPATYTIRTDVEVQPVTRRFVATPFDGPLQECHVRSGDVVRRGDLLATINPRELQYELAGVQAELKQAIQEKNARKAKHEFAESRLAELESERLQLQSDLLIHRQSNLEIRSPIDGVVVMGDWRQSEGMPLSRGEKLFEIAPLSKMKFELLIPESEIQYVRQGMIVSAMSHAVPQLRFDGRIVHMHPGTQLRDQQNVFVAEILIDNPDGLLQPGMRGKATVYSDRHAIGWNLFHRPWFAFRAFIGV